MPSNEETVVDDPAEGTPSSTSTEPAESTESTDPSGESAGTSSETGAVTSNVVSEPSDAFQALGNEIRIGILETMLERVDAADTDEPDTRARSTFSELFETTGLETSAQFAYHLEQLVGPYLRKTDSGYEFTYAGLQIARAIATGAYTHRVDHPPISLEEPCPFCETDALEARTTDNVVTVSCEACDRSLLSLQFPPAGLAAHGRGEGDGEEERGSNRGEERGDDADVELEGHDANTETKSGRGIADAFDRHHRHRLALMRDGVCPECSGDVDATLVPTPTAVEDALPEELTDHVQASFECRQCGHDLRCPVTLTLLQHPAVVSFYYDHGEDVRERPIWNVGHEWAESVLSTDPLCVRVVVELEDEVLALYVDASLRVVEVQRAESGTGSGVADETRAQSRSQSQAQTQTRTQAKTKNTATDDTASPVDTANTESSVDDSTEGTTSA